jgi:hypothetical protein
MTQEKTSKELLDDLQDIVDHYLKPSLLKEAPIFALSRAKSRLPMKIIHQKYWILQKL